MIEDNKQQPKDDSIHFYGHVAKMPKNVKAAHSLNFLEKIKISKQKLWYIIIEKQDFNELQTIKYNNRIGVNLKDFSEALKLHYQNNPEMKEHIEKLVIDGNDKFSMIRNIPDVEINGKKLMTILMEDLIKLLK
jgi:hypothetical protein